MEIRQIQDKVKIEAFLRNNSSLNFYQIADLEEPFWSKTEWHAACHEDTVRALAMVYLGFSSPIVTVLAEESDAMTKELLTGIVDLLPGKFYAALTLGLREVLEAHYDFQSHGVHWKMALKRKEHLRTSPLERAEILSAGNFEEISEFFTSCYPGNWWNIGMLESGFYRGIRVDGAMVAVGGTHIVSRQYRVAALGNIVTHPKYRGQGMAAEITSAVCHSLLNEVDLIGLNVHSENLAAISCYQKLGFDFVAAYEESDCVRYS